MACMPCDSAACRRASRSRASRAPLLPPPPPPHIVRIPYVGVECLAPLPVVQKRFTFTLGAERFEPAMGLVMAVDGLALSAPCAALDYLRNEPVAHKSGHPQPDARELVGAVHPDRPRSEERRVGKESRARL